MQAPQVENSSLMSGSNPSNAILRYLHERHLSSGNRLAGSADVWDHPTIQIPDAVSKHSADMLGLRNYLIIPALNFASFQTMINQEPPAWQTHLENATTIEDIILVIKYFGSMSIADRLYYLYDLPSDGPDQKPMDLESLKGFALFIMNNTYLPYPDITLNPDGRITVEWEVVYHGVLILEFLSSKLVEYLDVLQPSGLAHQSQYSGGVSSIYYVTDAVKQTIHKLMSQ